MGRAKKKRRQKKKEYAYQNSIRIKMGKPIFFTPRIVAKLKGISNRFNYKANMH